MNISVKNQMNPNNNPMNNHSISNNTVCVSESKMK